MVTDPSGRHVAQSLRAAQSRLIGGFGNDPPLPFAKTCSAHRCIEKPKPVRTAKSGYLGSGIGRQRCPSEDFSNRDRVRASPIQLGQRRTTISIRFMVAVPTPKRQPRD